MLTSHELFGFMSPAMAGKILDHAYDNDRDLYRLALNAVAEARKLRPTFFERKPRAERHLDMTGMLAKPRLDMISGNLIRSWLMKKQGAMLIDFLDALGLPHQDGAIENIPDTMEEARIHGAVEKLLGKYPHEEVAVYLHAFYTMNEVHWPTLKNQLQNEPRLQFGN